MCGRDGSSKLLLCFLSLLWPAAAEFPAGPGWEWVSSMAEMGGKEYGEVAKPLVRMNRNALIFGENIMPIEGWALSAKVEPLWQMEGEGVLALVYEEVEVQRPRAVIAFRGRVDGNLIDVCALQVLADNPDDRNTTLISWCYATYSASTFDYYAQAVAYTMRVLESYAPSSVLLSGTSMGGMVADLAGAGVLTHYSTALPVVTFMSLPGRANMLSLGLSVQGHDTSFIGAAIQWDPLVMLYWDHRIGPTCLFPTEEPPVCAACYAGNSLMLPSHDRPTYSLQSMSDICYECKFLTHDSLLLLDLMLEGVNPTCYLMEDNLPPFAVAEYKNNTN